MLLQEAAGVQQPARQLRLRPLHFRGGEGGADQDERPGDAVQFREEAGPPLRFQVLQDVQGQHQVEGGVLERLLPGRGRSVFRMVAMPQVGGPDPHGRVRFCVRFRIRCRVRFHVRFRVPEKVRRRGQVPVLVPQQAAHIQDGTPGQPRTHLRREAVALVEVEREAQDQILPGTGLGVDLHVVDAEPGSQGEWFEDHVVSPGGDDDRREFDRYRLALRIDMDLGHHGAAGPDPQGGEVGRGGDGEAGRETDRSGQPVQKVESRGVPLHVPRARLQRRPSPARQHLQGTGGGDEFRFGAGVVMLPRRRPLRHGGSLERRQELEVVGGHGEAVGHGQVQFLQRRDPEGGGPLEAVGRLRPPEMERVRRGAGHESVRVQDPDRLPEAGARVRKVLQQVEQGDDARAAAGEGEFLGVALHQEGARGRVLGEGVAAQVQPHRPPPGTPDRLRQVAVGATQFQPQALGLERRKQLDPRFPIRMRASISFGRIPAGLAVEVVVIVEAALPPEAGRIVRTSPPGSHDWPARYHARSGDF